MPIQRFLRQSLRAHAVSAHLPSHAACFFTAPLGSASARGNASRMSKILYRLFEQGNTRHARDPECARPFHASSRPESSQLISLHSTTSSSNPFGPLCWCQHSLTDQLHHGIFPWRLRWGRSGAIHLVRWCMWCHFTLPDRAKPHNEGYIQLFNDGVVPIWASMRAR